VVFSLADENQREIKEILRLKTLCVSLSVASLRHKICGVVLLKNKNW